MKVRVKFSKAGCAVYVGHLDTMRYFQKAVRRADLSPAFTAGFSPHMIMSFAAPLGVGMESRGEYFDIELGCEELSGEEITRRLDAQMAEGFSVLGAVRVEGGKSGNAMSLVAACDYRVRLWGLPFSLGDVLPGFLAQEHIFITKEGKAGLREVDIRECLYEVRLLGEDELFLCLASASSNYTRPDQVVGALLAYAGADPAGVEAFVCRLEVYAQQGEDFVPLLSLGEKI